MVLTEEIQLKELLDKKGFRFGDRFPTCGFVVSFLDKGTGALLSSNIFKSPIDGVSNLPKICEATHRKADDVQIVLDFGFDYQTRKICDINVELDKYIYFDKPKPVSTEDGATSPSE